jgi:hypothetical protein
MEQIYELHHIVFIIFVITCNLTSNRLIELQLMND